VHSGPGSAWGTRNVVRVVDNDFGKVPSAIGVIVDESDVGIGAEDCAGCGGWTGDYAFAEVIYAIGVGVIDNHLAVIPDTVGVGVNVLE